VKGKANPGTLDLTRPQGYVIEMALPRAGRILAVMVTGAESEARQEGVELVWAVCSEACGAALREALRAETESNFSL